ncbi:MAG TPA: protein translocase subunit SecF [Mycobacteriales bacterium]|nr:protein translocase subunit SecF [Mycobacteriales bacterium]
MSFLSRLYHGETALPFIARRKVWYVVSGIAMVICILSIVLRGFNLGVDFKGGNSFQFPTGSASTSDVQSAADSSGVATESVQKVGSGSSANFVVKTRVIPESDTTKLKNALAGQLGKQISVKGAPLTPSEISQNQVSASWGSDITHKAVTGLIVFLIGVSIFISILFEWRLAAGALVGLFHDLVLAAGIYSLVGFEVTPSTVVGLLTILGYSLYDNIVVYDKLRENSRGLMANSRQTYSEAANRAINETLARSINTSLFAILPVAGLLFVGAGVLGVGTIKDLALVLFVGLLAGAYSSLFLATPIACDLKERQPEYVALRKRVAAKRSAEVRRSAAKAAPEGGGVAVLERESEPEPVPSEPPRPGARPANRQRKARGGSRPQSRRRR